MHGFYYMETDRTPEQQLKAVEWAATAVEGAYVAASW
eukprot:COSAG05_NODE_857_length_6940_cov_4.243385_3_plen_37_part_00